MTDRKDPYSLTLGKLHGFLAESGNSNKDFVQDTGILDKVFIAVPGLSKEAMQFAKRQGIRVFTVSQLEPLTQENPKS